MAGGSQSSLLCRAPQPWARSIFKYNPWGSTGAPSLNPLRLPLPGTHRGSGSLKEQDERGLQLDQHCFLGSLAHLEPGPAIGVSLALGSRTPPATSLLGTLADPADTTLLPCSLGLRTGAWAGNRLGRAPDGRLLVQAQSVCASHSLLPCRVPEAAGEGSAARGEADLSRVSHDAAIGVITGGPRWDPPGTHPASRPLGTSADGRINKDVLSVCPQG